MHLCMAPVRIQFANQKWHSRLKWNVDSPRNASHVDQFSIDRSSLVYTINFSLGLPMHRWWSPNRIHTLLHTALSKDVKIDTATNRNKNKNNRTFDYEATITINMHLLLCRSGCRHASTYHSAEREMELNNKKIVLFLVVVAVVREYINTKTAKSAFLDSVSFYSRVEWMSAPRFSSLPIDRVCSSVGIVVYMLRANKLIEFDIVIRSFSLSLVV